AAPSSHSGGTGSRGTITPFRKTAFSMASLLLLASYPLLDVGVGGATRERSPTGTVRIRVSGCAQARPGSSHFGVRLAQRGSRLARAGHCETRCVPALRTLIPPF